MRSRWLSRSSAFLQLLRRILPAACGLLALPVGGGCGKTAPPRGPVAAQVATIDQAVIAITAAKTSARPTAALLEPLRRNLTAGTPEVRGLAAQAIAAVGDWESMPTLLKLLEDDDRVVRARAAAATTELLGVDYHFDTDAPAEDRERVRRSIVRVYEDMKRNPPERYRQ